VPHPGARRRVLAAAAAVLGVACAPGVPQTLPAPEHDHATLRARRLLERGRALAAEERFAAAERVARRGLEAVPDHARLMLLRARMLARLGRSAEAEAVRARADELLPPRPPPPETPLPGGGHGVSLLLLPPEAPGEPPERVPAWPGGEVLDAARRHLRARLPEAGLRDRPPSPFASAAAAADWLGAPGAVLSLRVDRAFCGETLKDGAFALVWVRVAAAAAGRLAGRPLLWREVLDEPRPPTSCRRDAVRWALEAVLAQPEVREALEAGAAGPPADASWRPEALHALLPALERRHAEALERGREALRSGDPEAARAAFGQAVALLPEGSEASTHLAELERSLDLEAQLTARSPLPRSDAPGRALLAERPDPDAVAALERQLARERRERARLTAALGEIAAPPAPVTAATLAVLQPVDIEDPRAPGPRLAARRYGRPTPLEARVLYGPDGSVVARFFFGPEGGAPLLREQDTDGDGRPDRWLAFEEGRPVEAWEDDEATGLPTLHVRYPSGENGTRYVDIDRDQDGRPEHVLQYVEGRLAAESVDADGDGRFERFDRFDADGRLALREEDRDGDGEIDVRSRYRDGRLLRRELLDPAALEGPR